MLQGGEFYIQGKMIQRRISNTKLGGVDNSSALHIILFALTSHLSSKFLARTVNLEFNLHKRKKKMQHGTSKMAEFSYSPLHIVATN
jgi:hypothetical protein